ncbi:hypothetical protein C8046_15865 [Serinibacter arcticus]|uniref:D-alanyl-D-alanine carboxypeptidase-like core domain-containing protein n=1 Tax=Serinibacter arcticus TaxID=1655435 RepID=A0A2U1ZY30_9MICO|nr:M15 family metallopeptidase [Serinibacter arcticus]PWD51898.1 hypothetical protein C8046_15865 [Serinibacter arcticus]
MVRTSPRHRLALVLALVLAGTLGLALPTAPASAVPVADGVYAIEHTGEIYRVSAGTARHLTYSEWVDLGRPSPQPAPTSYVGYAWSTGISSVTRWDPDVPASWTWRQVGYDAWVRVGRPSPAAVGWVEGSYVYRWATNDQIGVIAPDGTYRWLTPAEWAAMGHRAPDVRRNEGFVSLTWGPEIFRMTDLASGRGEPLDYAGWRRENFPTPRPVTALADHRYERYSTQSSIWYAGPMVQREISHAEWSAVGRPAPTVLPAGASSPWPAGRPAPYSGQYRAENGRIDGEMCVIPFMPTHRIHCRALNDLVGFNRAYSARFGTDLPIDDWRYSTYRTQADQQVVLDTITAPIVAAVGTSPHGWGLAIDFLEGPRYGFGSTIHTWLRTNGPAYGWELMPWHREDGRYKEYWHFDYVR